VATRLLLLQTVDACAMQLCKRGLSRLAGELGRETADWSYTVLARESARFSGGTPLKMKKVYLAYALLALVVIFLLYAQLSHAPA
jgi:hypothetical protein